MRENINDPDIYFLDFKLENPAEPNDFTNAIIKIDPYLGEDLKLAPGEKIEIEANIKHVNGSKKLYFGYEYTLHTRNKKFHKYRTEPYVDSILLSEAVDWQTIAFDTEVPYFSTDSFWISPVITIDREHCDARTAFLIKDLHYHFPYTKGRDDLFRAYRFSGQNVGIDRQIYDRPQIQDEDKNFVMGFVYIWDQDFYDVEKGQYTVDHYCELMKQEFGGFNSVILWQGFIMLGIDQRNQFDMLRRMPGGLEKMREVVDQFHQHGIKVYVSYMPWDETTRRENITDQEVLAFILDSTGIDGVYFDTFANRGRIFREAAGKKDSSIVFSTELCPSIYDIQGKQAITASWVQWGPHQPTFADAYDEFGVLHLKWIVPDHMQFQIKRYRRDHTEEMMAAWINGSGMMVWENVFGTWNPWSQENKKQIRKMNPIWQRYADVYTSDNWKPYYPTHVDGLNLSVWENDSITMINLVNVAAGIRHYSVPEEFVSEKEYVFNLWNGRKINPGQSIPVNQFGCILLRRDKEDKSFTAFLGYQENIHSQAITGPDEYAYARSLKEYEVYQYPDQPKNPVHGLLPVKGGIYHLDIVHNINSGGCYPDPDAKEDHVWSDYLRIGSKNHHLKIETGPYHIMPRVVTNGDYEKFLRATGYEPEVPGHFLAHWQGRTCPDSLQDKPVVYVDINDARAYAVWAGMRIPTEYEWQTGAEQNGDQFIYNEVYELTEGIRNDGHNRFIMLRGGCASWRPRRTIPVCLRCSPCGTPGRI